MSTIEELVSSGAISRIEAELDSRFQPMRLLYGTPNFIGWLNEILQGAEPPNRLGEATPGEQIDELFHTYLVGMPLTYTKQFRFVRAEKNAVWELKTTDVRIFGWFLKMDCFVGVFGDWAYRVKDHDLYRGYRIAIRRIRRELGVDDTLCVAGVSPNDVLSF